VAGIVVEVVVVVVVHVGGGSWRLHWAATRRDT
jgi:hypothetical protein